MPGMSGRVEEAALTKGLCLRFMRAFLGYCILVPPGVVPYIVVPPGEADTADNRLGSTLCCSMTREWICRHDECRRRFGSVSVRATATYRRSRDRHGLGHNKRGIQRVRPVER